MAITPAIGSNKPAGLATLVGLLCVTAVSALAQAPAPSGVPAAGASQPAADVAKPSTAKHPHPAKGHSGKAAVEPIPLAETHLPDPPPPNWPVNSAAVPASIAWNGRDLSIAASNASLVQILHDVSVATGLKVEGLADSQDKQSGQSQSGSGDQKGERIYGNYGPASERDVLTQLLDGSGYNVLMIGNQGEGTPRELVLTAKASDAGAKGQPGSVQQRHDVEEEAPEEPEPVDPQPDPNLHRPPGIPPQPGQGRTPQQIMQEMQQRQQLQQQQQQGTQPPPQPQPANPNN
jgi:hypothetical protein